MNPAAATMGPLLLGLMFNLILLGMIFVQYYMYYIKYQRKQVYALLLVNVAGTVLYMVDMYIALILNFGNANSYNRSTWLGAARFLPLPGDLALTAIMAGAVQLFFAWRVKILTSSWISALSVFFTALLEVAGGIATAAEANAQEAVTDFQKFKITVIIWLVSSCVCDFLITGALSFDDKESANSSPGSRGHKTGFEQSNEVMDRIIRLTVQTGLITSLCAMMDLITFLAIASPNIHIIFTGMLGKLYTNALMSSLNARSGWSYSVSSKTNLDTSRKVERHEMTPMGTQRVSESDGWKVKQGDML
ncbi:hypothetical protein DFS33DRAFT_1439321 [Desarmillaria ectypa]|nr:hypothetical protein DFS33DRAFT_1439321 [Desarmillaria ectypa]